MNWFLYKFDDLSPFELYDLLRLRSEVFVVEQNCVFLDMDNYDQQCFHLLGYEGNTLAAATRLVPPGIIYPLMSIGRVVTAPAARGTGAGKEVMQRSVKACYDLFGKGNIRIGAQLYLKKFYATFGFEVTSDVYLEDGIEHIYMLKKADDNENKEDL